MLHKPGTVTCTGAAGRIAFANKLHSAAAKISGVRRMKLVRLLDRKAIALRMTIFARNSPLLRLLPLLTLVLTSLFFSLTLAQSPAVPAHDALLEKLTGHWVMTGTIGKQDVTHDVDVDWILKRQYVRIHEVSREKDADGELAYEAWIHIVWDKENAEYAVMWLDNTGTTNFAAEGVGHGKPDGDRILFVWKSADLSGIRNTFAFDRASETWSWTIDNVDKSGTLSPFAKLTLKRK